MSERVQNVRVVVTCPACSSPDYEVEFDGNEIAEHVTVEIPCDECPNGIAVDVNVTVQVSR